MKIEFRDILIGAAFILNQFPVLNLNQKDFKKINGIELYPFSFDLKSQPQFF
jgi:predicted nucleic acid-binding protein